MSIGKSSIARAVNATATKTTTITNDNTITKFAIDNIGALSVAKAPHDVDTIKENIKKRGVLCPVLVAVTTKGDVWLIDGYRRYHAAKELGISELVAAVTNVENKSEANRIYTELSKTKPIVVSNDTSTIHEEKFRVVAIKDRDLPIHLL